MHNLPKTADQYILSSARKIADDVVSKLTPAVAEKRNGGEGGRGAGASINLEFVNVRYIVFLLFFKYILNCPEQI